MVERRHGSAGPGGGSTAGQPSTLRLSEERFRLLVDSVLDYAIFALDPTGRVTTWNAGAARLKGYSADEIIGEHYSVFYPPDTRSQGVPEQLLARAREEGRVENTGWRVRKDGSRFWADVVLTALYDDDGELAGYAKVTRDRTVDHEMTEAREMALAEQRRLVAQLEELDAWRRDFMSSVAHDLQTPVAAITGFATLLRDGEVPPADVPVIIDNLLANTGSLQELIDNLRGYTVLAERDPPLERRSIELGPLLRRLVAASAPLLDGRSVEVDAPELEAAVDPHGVERIVRNLLTNAARHTPAGTEVIVRARSRAADGAVCIDVEDDGPGIEPELLPRIFDRFERGGGGGTGLGLAIARRWAELHGGQITVESTPGAGTTFHVLLPTAGERSG